MVTIIEIGDQIDRKISEILMRYIVLKYIRINEKLKQFQEHQ